MSTLNFGSGESLRMTFVTKPSVPSEPTMSCLMSYPVTSLTSLPPS